MSAAPGLGRALDGWMSRRLMQVADALPEKEDTTRGLVRLVVLERDLELSGRARTFGLDAEDARGLEALVRIFVAAVRR